MKLLFINVFNLNRMFLRVIFQYLIFFIGKVTETITVHDKWVCQPVFLCIESKLWMIFRKKSFFQWFCSYLHVLPVKTLISQNWACSWNLLIDLYYCLSIGFVKSFYLNDLIAIWVLLLLKFFDSDILTWKVNRNRYCPWK